MQQITVKDFDLKRTLESGQFFHFQKIGRLYYIHNSDKVFAVAQEGNKLYFDGANKFEVSNFLGLNEDFAKVKESLMKDKIIREVIKEHQGIRLMNQDPWQCTMSFICSSFSNIKKIQHNVYALSKQFGSPVSFNKYTGYSFPTIGSLNNLKKIRLCAVGFRAKYLYEANKILSNDFFSDLRKLKYENAKNKLLEVPGIGEKVADCILLFSLGKTEAFPVDVWISRAMKENFEECKKMNERKIAEFGRERWGRLAGYAQQYVYHWRRMK